MSTEFELTMKCFDCRCSSCGRRFKKLSFFTEAGEPCRPRLAKFAVCDKCVAKGEVEKLVRRAQAKVELKKLEDDYQRDSLERDRSHFKAVNSLDKIRDMPEIRSQSKEWLKESKKRKLEFQQKWNELYKQTLE